MLNAIWAAFLLVGFAVALYRGFIDGELHIFKEVVGATFSMSKTAFEISIGLTGVMCLWLGFMKLGERGGAVNLLARGFRPLFRRLFPGIPEDHPAAASIVMNMAANMLGLDNAATPLGLKAMKELQTLNPTPERASDDQILFLVINTSSVTLIPVTILAWRAQMGAADPSDVFLPILIATFASTLAGLILTGLVQKLRLWDPVVLCYILGLGGVIALMIAYFTSLDKQALELQSAALANLVIMGIITFFLLLAWRKKVAFYETFVEGAKEGFQVAVGIIPYLVAMLVALGVFRASGALDIVLDAIRRFVFFIGLDTAFVDGLPTAFMKPLSGSGSRAMMLETMESHGVDSYAGRLACVLQGSTETTFYILAVYFGAVGIKRSRHAVACGLFADLIGIIAAILLAGLFFG